MGHLSVTLMVSLLCVYGARPQEKQRLVVLMIDGMRWDYIERDHELKGFPRIFKNGVKVPHVTPIFPSVSFPNWYTIATGLYAESHGMIDNTIFDPVRHTTLTLPPSHSGDEEYWWNKTEPIWVNAEKNHIRTAMHWWDGCRVSIRGFRPKICDMYRPFKPWPSVLEDTRKVMVNLLDWFKNGEKNRLGMVYFEGPDHFGHGHGPDSEELNQTVRDIDTILNIFQDKLEESTMKNEVNLVIVSDHGMTETSGNLKIDLSDTNISRSVDKVLGGGAYMSILPKPGRTNEVYNKLKSHPKAGLKVYLREEIPEIYHFKNSELTMPILLVADLGYSISWGRSKRSKHHQGSHGYDPYQENSPMKTIMYARGPSFKQGFIGEPLHQIDHYNVFCHALGIPAHPNNGSWDRVKSLLQDSTSFQARSSGCHLTPTGSSTAIIFMSLVQAFTRN